MEERGVKWLTQDTPGGVHVMPIDDLVLHRESECCVCHPSIRLEGTTCLGWDKLHVRKVIVHAAMDGRP